MAKTVYFTSAAATTHRGDNTAKLAGATSWWTPMLLAEARGSGVASLTAASIAGTTVGIEFASGSTAVEFISEPLSADFTISGTITGNLWGFESTMNDNTAINFVVDKIDGATGVITEIAKSARIAELATATGVNNFTVTPATVTDHFPASNLNQQIYGDAASGDQRAQSFLADAGTLTEVRATLYKAGTPTDNLIVEVQTDSGGVPSGTVLGTVATQVCSALTTGGGVLTYSCSIALPTAGTYWLVARRSGAGDVVNYPGWKAINSNSYAGGRIIGRFSGAWSAATTNDGLFGFTQVVTAKRGDRIRIRPFIDDIGTAMIVGTSTFRYNGATAAADGDSYVTFTENLTFEPATPDISRINSGAVNLSSSLDIADAATREKWGTKFVASGNTITSVLAYLAKANTPSDNLILEIWSDSGGVPGSSVGTVATVSAASLTLSAVAYTYSGLSIAVTHGQTYWLVFRRSGAVDSTNRSRTYLTTDIDTGSTFSYDGSTWTVATFTEIAYVITGSGVPTSTYYLTDTAESINPGSAVEKKALTTRGSTLRTAFRNTVAGPTSGIQSPPDVSGDPLEWYTPPLEAVTFGGKAKFNIWAKENNLAANASLKAEIAVTASDGSGTTVWGVANIESSSTGGELTTTDAAYAAWVSGDDVSVTAGQRLRFRLYVDDAAIGPLVTGFAVTFSWNGTTASAAGDTYVILPVAVVEQQPVLEQTDYRFRNDDGDETTATWMAAVNTPATVALDTQFRIRIAVEVTNLAFASNSYLLQFRRKPSGGAYGAWTGTYSGTSSQISAQLVTSTQYAGPVATTQQISAGTFYAGTLDENTNASAITNQPVGSTTEIELLVKPKSANGAADGDEYELRLVKALPSNAVLDTYTVTPTLTVGTVGPTTYYGSATVSLTDTRVSAGFRQTFAAASVALVDAVTTSGSRKALGAATVALVDTVTAGGIVKKLGASSVAIINVRVTNGIRRTFASALVALANTRVTLGRFTGKTGSTVALVDTITSNGVQSTSAVTHTGSATVSLVNTRVTSATRLTKGAATVALTDVVTTAALRKALGAATVALVNTRVTNATRKTMVAATVALVDTITTGATRKALGAATVSLIDTITASATRRTAAASVVALTNTRVTLARVTFKTSTTVALVDTITTGAIRRAVAAAVVALTNVRTTAARILARSASVTSESVGVFSAGQISGTTTTHYGSSTVALVNVRTTNAVRKTTGAASVPLVNSRVTSANVTFRTGATVPLVVSRVTSATRKAITSATVALTNTRVSAARLTAKGNPGIRGEIVTVTSNGVVSSAPIWYGAATVSLVNTRVTNATRKAITGSTVSLTNTRVTVGRISAKGSAGTRAEVVTVFSNGIATASPIWYGASYVALTNVRTTGSRVRLNTSATVGLVVGISTGSRLRPAGIIVLNYADGLYLGEQPVDAAYVGETKVWP